MGTAKAGGQSSRRVDASRNKSFSSSRSRRSFSDRIGPLAACISAEGEIAPRSDAAERHSFRGWRMEVGAGGRLRVIAGTRCSEWRRSEWNGREAKGATFYSRAHQLFAVWYHGPRPQSVRGRPVPRVARSAECGRRCGSGCALAHVAAQPSCWCTARMDGHCEIAPEGMAGDGC